MDRRMGQSAGPACGSVTPSPQKFKVNFEERDGQYIVYAIYYTTAPDFMNTNDAQRDYKMAKYDEQFYWTDPDPSVPPPNRDSRPPFVRKRVGWARNEQAAQKIFGLLKEEVARFEWGMWVTMVPLQLAGKLEMWAEICNYSLAEKRFYPVSYSHLASTMRPVYWDLQDVRLCIQRFEEASDDEILLMYGKYRRKERSTVEVVLCCATCLCCCAGPDSTSTRVKC